METFPKAHIHKVNYLIDQALIKNNLIKLKEYTRPTALELLY